MNENQKQFLNDLNRLLCKHNVIQVKTGEDGRTHFYSNGQDVSFASYQQRAFQRVATAQDAYNPTDGGGKRNDQRTAHQNPMAQPCLSRRESSPRMALEA